MPDHLAKPRATPLSQFLAASTHGTPSWPMAPMENRRRVPSSPIPPQARGELPTLMLRLKCEGISIVPRAHARGCKLPYVTATKRLYLSGASGLVTSPPSPRQLPLRPLGTNAVTRPRPFCPRAVSLSTELVEPPLLPAWLRAALEPPRPSPPRTMSPSARPAGALEFCAAMVGAASFKPFPFLLVGGSSPEAEGAPHFPAKPCVAFGSPRRCPQRTIVPNSTEAPFFPTLVRAASSSPRPFPPRRVVSPFLGAVAALLFRAGRSAAFEVPRVLPPWTVVVSCFLEAEAAAPRFSAWFLVVFSEPLPFFPVAGPSAEADVVPIFCPIWLLPAFGMPLALLFVDGSAAGPPPAPLFLVTARVAAAKPLPFLFIGGSSVEVPAVSFFAAWVCAGPAQPLEVLPFDGSSTESTWAPLFFITPRVALPKPLPFLFVGESSAAEAPAAFFSVP